MKCRFCIGKNLKEILFHTLEKTRKNSTVMKKNQF